MATAPQLIQIPVPGSQDLQQNRRHGDIVGHGLQFIILNVNLVYIDNRLCADKQ